MVMEKMFSGNSGLFYLLSVHSYYTQSKNSKAEKCIYVSCCILLAWPSSQNRFSSSSCQRCIDAHLVRKKIEKSIEKSMWFVILGGRYLFCLALVQFSGDSLSTMLAIYSNPHNVEIGSSILVNLKRFVTEVATHLHVSLFIIWARFYSQTLEKLK